MIHSYLTYVANFVLSLVRNKQFHQIDRHAVFVFSSAVDFPLGGKTHCALIATHNVDFIFKKTERAKIELDQEL